LQLAWTVARGSTMAVGWTFISSLGEPLRPYWFKIDRSPD